jgi:hypothetical protein
VSRIDPSLEAVRAATAESIPSLLSSGDETILPALIENPLLDEANLCLLLERKELSGVLLEEIARQKQWRANYRVRCALAGHPHTPRLVAMKLLRDLHLMDLVRISLLAASPAELKRLAEERVLAQLPQLPLGQRITLARRGSARVAASLIAQGPEQVARVALENSFLTESQLLKTLAKENLPARVVAVIATHKKWSQLVNVRMALLRHKHAPLDRVLTFVSGLTLGELKDLLSLPEVPDNVRASLCSELAARGKT